MLLMAMGSNGDIQAFLSIAHRVPDCRVRIATHPAHRKLVLEHGYEFYDVGGSPEQFSKALGEEPNGIKSLASGSLRSCVG